MSFRLGGLLFLLLLLGCKQPALTSVAYNNDNRMEGVAPKEDYQEMIAPYREDLAATMDNVIAQITVPLKKEKPESKLGNLLADATKEMGNQYSENKVDIGIINYGGIRLPELNAGPLRLGTVYELMPFDNYVVILPMDPTTLETFCHAIAAKGGWPTSGLQFKIKDNRAVNITVNGAPLQRDKMYHLAISDYIANGGDGMSMLEAVPQENTNVLLRDAFIEYFEQLAAKGLAIEAHKEGRISYAK